MEKIIDVAKYISKKYFYEKNEKIDQMKLHKILFFTQKESFLKLGSPMFDEDFEGWKLGPVSREIRKYYDQISETTEDVFLNEKNEEIVNSVYEKYIDVDSYHLSYLTHLHYSWIKARIGLEKEENGSNIISKEDIKKDAFRRNGVE